MTMKPWEILQAQTEVIEKAMSEVRAKKRVSFEEFLNEKYMDSDHATDDPDKAEHWICELDVADVMELAQEWGDSLHD